MMFLVLFIHRLLVGLVSLAIIQKRPISRSVNATRIVGRRELAALYTRYIKKLAAIDCRMPMPYLFAHCSLATFYKMPCKPLKYTLTLCLVYAIASHVCSIHNKDLKDIGSSDPPATSKSPTSSPTTLPMPSLPSPSTTLPIS